MQTVLGLLLGVPLTLAAGRFLGSHLYTVRPVVTIAVPALVAAIIQAFRASSLSPVQVLREE